MKSKFIFLFAILSIAIIAFFFTKGTFKVDPTDITSMTLEASSDMPVQEETITLTNNSESFLINGLESPAPLEVNANTLLKVTVQNNSNFPTSIHFHGINGLSKMDGVGGVTQDNIEPNSSFTYEFNIDTPGTYMYHSHVDSANQVNNENLYGALIVNDEERTSYENKTVLLANSKIEGLAYHETDSSNISTSYINSKLSTNVKFKPNEDIYLSIINMASGAMTFYFGDDVEYQIIEVDANEVDSEKQVNSSLTIPTAQRVDIIITAPKDNFLLETINARNENATTQFEIDGPLEITNQKIPKTPLYLYDIISTKTDLGLSDEKSDREYTMNFDMSMGGWTINGATFPDTKDVEVTEGDIVDITLTNTGHMPQKHPFHLHGHQFQVIEYNGEKVEDKNLVLDTLNVRNGETYKIRFKADNPGIWMFHCHDLNHATKGMMTKVVYDNYFSSIGTEATE